MSDRLHSSEPAHVGHSRCQPDTRTSNPVLRGRTAIAKASNCCANSNSVFSPFNAAKATFALNAAVWFLRGRLLIILSSFRTSYGQIRRDPHHLSLCSVFPSHLYLRQRTVIKR